MFSVNTDWGDGRGTSTSYPALKPLKGQTKQGKDFEKLVSGTVLLGVREQDNKDRQKSRAPLEATTQGRSKKRRRAAIESGIEAPNPEFKSKVVPPDASRPQKSLDVVDEASEPKPAAAKKRRKKQAAAVGASHSEGLLEDNTPTHQKATPKNGHLRTTDPRTSPDQECKREGGRRLSSSKAKRIGVETSSEPDGSLKPGKSGSKGEGRQVEVPGAGQTRKSGHVKVVAREPGSEKEIGSGADAAPGGDVDPGVRTKERRRDRGSLSAEGEGGEGPGSSALLDKLSGRLSGSRFRWLNETLYTTTGDEAFTLLQEQPELFEQYHQGFEAQIKSWPEQPVDAAIEWLKTLPTALRVADFGCGNAALALAVPQKVACLDLIAAVPGVIECNMSDTPLDSESMDVAVFCLALMGTDYPSFLAEAARVLKPGGKLWIAEVRSRFVSGGSEDFAPFVRALKHLGFKLEHLDTANKFFVTLRLRKNSAQRNRAIEWPELKACLYKRR